ncbi:MAG: hypothetical protein BWY64_02400 [bacterium ADurb.Bin363]|nr:MAG: hypothetical protein BWY64_02400 [bacterium ADurb.Bin363]
MRLDLRYEITLYILPILGTGALTVLWSGLIKKLKKLTGFNWEALIILTVPLALLNAFSIFYLLIPEYYADKIGLWTKIVLLCIIMPLMYLVSFILIKFFRHKPKVSQEIKVVETRKKEDLIGCSATVTVPLKPTGKVVVDGDEENLTASSKSGQFINEGARVKIVTIKMGDLLVEEITE